MKGEGFVLNTFAHELTHHIRDWSPTKFKALADFLVKEYGKAGQSVDELVHARMARSDLDYDAAFEEVVADSMEKMFTDGNIMDKLAKLKAQDKGLLQRIKNFIDKWLSKIKEFYSAEGQYVTREGELAHQLERFEQLQQLFAEALVDAGENFRKAEKNTAEPASGNKLSPRKANTSGDFDYSGLNWASDLGIITAKDRAIFERTINNEIYRGAKPQSANGEYIIDTGRCLMFTDGDFHSPTLSRVIVFATEYESLLDEAKRRILYDAESTGDVQISQRVIENLYGPGFAIEYTPPVHGAYAGQNGRGKRANGKGGNRGYKAKSLRERLAEEGLEYLLDEELEPQSPRKSDRAYMDAVNRGNMETAQRMVDEAAKAAGYSRLFYHGAKKGGGFTTFRDWSYFTESRKYAERYAERDNDGSLYKTYVKLDKPFDTRNPADRRLFAQMRSEYGLGEIQDSGLPDWTDGYDISDFIDENDLDYDGIILDEGGDLVNGKPVSRGLSYVVRKSAQIKSADPVTYDGNGNVIPLSERFNQENKDIRYSYRGKNVDGIEVYETSEAIKKLPYTERIATFIDIMKKQFAGRTAKFTKNGQVYYARFDEADINKNVYGDKKSDKDGWKAKINVGADGNVFELVENAQYDGNSNESGKKIAAHKNVSDWDYYIKTVQIDNKVFDLVANVRKTVDDAYVYSIQLNRNKNKKASPPLGLLSKASNGVTNASNKTVPQSAPGVNANSNRNSDRTGESISNRSLLANAFESMAQNDIERQKIAEYKSKIEIKDAEERKLRDLKEQIKELSFAKGPRDTAKLRSLREEAIKTANRLSIYDGQLLRLEASVSSLAFNIFYR